MATADMSKVIRVFKEEVKKFFDSIFEKHPNVNQFKIKPYVYNEFNSFGLAEDSLCQVNREETEYDSDGFPVNEFHEEILDSVTELFDQESRLSEFLYSLFCLEYYCNEKTVDIFNEIPILEVTRDELILSSEPS